MHARYGVRFFPLLVGLFWLVVGVSMAVSSRIAPKILRWNYICAWMIMFGLPCMLLFRLSIRQSGTGVPEQETESAHTDRYKKAFPQLSSQDVDQEIETGSENVENQGESKTTHSLSGANNLVLTRKQASMIKRLAEEEKKKRQMQMEG